MFRKSDWIVRTSSLLAASALCLFPFTCCRATAPEEPLDTRVLEQISKVFTQIAKKTIPATVFIKAQTNPSSRNSGFDDPFHQDFLRRFFGFPYGREAEPQISGGSGFFVTNDGYIVTNHHVIQDADEITVILNDGREFQASVVGADPRTDLAVLKIDEKNLPYLVFGNSDQLEIGEWVVAVGTPFALQSSVTAGIVSAKGRQDLGITSLEDFLQTDAAINPGNSGGPLSNLKGEVIGVNTAIVSRSGGYMGIGFSIPSQMAQSVIEQIIEKGSVSRAYLGVIPQAFDKDLADAWNSPNQDGILVSEVMKDSPAEKGGLRQGDVITHYNGHPAKSVTKFRTDLALMKPGDQIHLKVLRNHKTISLAISLGSLKDPQESLVEKERIYKMGIEVETLSSEMAAKMNYPINTEGVVITKVAKGSAAEKAGLRASFVITGIAVSSHEYHPTRNVSEFNEALEELSDRKHIIVIVRHQNYQRYYTIKLD